MMKLRSSGFTLIELMITVVIVAILARIAYPGYTQYLARSHRTEAKAGLVEIASAQERYYLANNSYTGTVATVYSGTTKYFTFSTTGNTTGFLITAEAKGGQLKDTDCKFFYLSETGAKTAKKSDGTTVSDAECWR